MLINIITNGLLLTPEVVDRMLPFGLNGVKITLDGDATRTTGCGRCAAARAPSIASSRTSAAWPTACRIAIGGNFDETLGRQLSRRCSTSCKAQEFADKLVKVNFKPIIRTAAGAAPKGDHAADSGRRRGASR